MKRKRGCYSGEFKWNVVLEVVSGKFTNEEARKINSNYAILYWMRVFSGNENYR